MSSLRGPKDWDASVSRRYRWPLYILVAAGVFTAGVAALKVGQWSLGLLNFVGLIVFLIGAGGANTYDRAPHKYSATMLRVVLPTRYQQSIVYILPSLGRGFDAVWSPKIAYEHQALEKITEGWNGKDKLDLGSILPSFLASVQLSKKEVEALATWLYMLDDTESDVRKMRRIRCQRQKSVLIGRYLMYALCHAEFVVRGLDEELEPGLRQLIGRLRRRSQGRVLPADLRWRRTPDDDWELQIGKGSKEAFRDAHRTHILFKGYKEAVDYVYKLLGQDGLSDEVTENYSLRPPKNSNVLARCPQCKDQPTPQGMEDYMGALWYHCLMESDTTFEALYAFSCYFDAEVKNSIKYGWNDYPLLPHSYSGDFTSWHVIWRQAWYNAVVAQLVTQSANIFSAFINGILQL
jgi:hypothetical protein